MNLASMAGNGWRDNLDQVLELLDTDRDDIAPVVAFLLSDNARWFRGANITPDGGMGAHLALKRYGL